jgi:hypothetical protein
MIHVLKSVTYLCRQKGGFEALGAQMRASKVDDDGLTQLSLEILAAAVRLDGHCKAAISEKPDILQCITKLLANEQVKSLCTPFHAIACMTRVFHNYMLVCCCLPHICKSRISMSSLLRPQEKTIAFPATDFSGSVLCRINAVSGWRCF